MTSKTSKTLLLGSKTAISNYLPSMPTFSSLPRPAKCCQHEPASSSVRSFLFDFAAFLILALFFSALSSVILSSWLKALYCFKRILLGRLLLAIKPSPREMQNMGLWDHQQQHINPGRKLSLAPFLLQPRSMTQSTHDLALIIGRKSHLNDIHTLLTFCRTITHGSPMLAMRIMGIMTGQKSRRFGYW